MLRSLYFRQVSNKFSTAHDIARRLKPSTSCKGIGRHRIVYLTLALAIAATASTGCESKARIPAVVHQPSGSTPLKTGVINFVRSQGARAMASRWSDLALVGAKMDASVKAGELVTVTLYWEVLDDMAQVPTVFIHAREPAAARKVAQADHALMGVKGPSSWNRGDIIEDSVDFTVPRSYDVDTLEILAGLYRGKTRFEVKDGPHEKDNRVVVGTIKITGERAALPTMEAPKLRSDEVARIDGVLDESFWKRAQRVGPFIRHDGSTKIRRPTFARIAWDEDSLYLAFECDDDDAHTPYTKRDDPLYKSEAVEIFIDADGDRDEYVELQAAPNDLQFDAAFKGGARKNFDTGYDATYVVKTKVDGTVNDGSDKDRGWVSEWKISISSLRDIPSPPKVGTEWKINLFRLERMRRGDKVVGNEATAWSSPLSGDFHNLRRFGTLKFGP